MSNKPFDAATKHLVEIDPDAWLRYAGLPGTDAELLDADLSTVTSEADRILRVTNPDYLAHIELQTTYKADMPYRVLRYNTLTFCRYLLPVQSVVFLLRKEADGPAMSGQVGYVVPESTDGALKMNFRVVRVWEKDPEEVLSGALATLPLAPLSDVAESDLPAVIRRMEERIREEASSSERDTLWTTTYLLMGLRYEPDLIEHLLQGVLTMRESSTYMKIYEEGEASGISKGEAQGTRNTILHLGQKRFGTPNAQTVAALAAVTALEALERLTERLLEVESWEELLQAPD